MAFGVEISLVSESLRVVTKVALLGVLLDGRVGLVGGDLHLGAALLGDLHDEVERPVPGAERHVVPRGHLAVGAVDEEDAVVERLGLALVLGLELGGPEERGGGEPRALEAHRGAGAAAAAPEGDARQAREAGRRGGRRRDRRRHSGCTWGVAAGVGEERVEVAAAAVTADWKVELRMTRR